MSSQTNFDLEVRTRIPAGEYKLLHRVASENGTTVGALVSELVRRELAPTQKRPRRQSNYTPELGEQIAELRRFRRSWAEVEAELQIHTATAKRYMLRFAAEQRTKTIGARSQLGQTNRKGTK